MHGKFALHIASAKQFMQLFQGPVLAGQNRAQRLFENLCDLLETQAAVVPQMDNLLIGIR